MSATNRGAVRSPSDFYETPAWCVRALLDAWRPPRGIWCDPCAGNGAIIRASDTGTWTACELREECRGDLEQLRARGIVTDYVIGDFLGSSKRLHLFRRMPDVYVLSKRPSFTGGGTDACEYAWFVWRKDKGTGPGALRVI